MTPATFPLDRADAPIFADGLGERVLAADASTGELLQVLRLRPELTAVPSFEFALRERTARLMNFRHAYYARVRRVDRLTGGGGLAIVSDHVEGTRLSDVLRVAHQRGLQLDTNAALCLIRQLVPAVSLLHENARDASHGLIAPERLVVTPHARLVIVEHVLGSGIEQLQFARDRLWQEFRVAIPSSAGMARFDHRADVNGIGITALSLVLGRPLTADEVPHAVPQLLMQARERTAMGEERPLSNAFRNWLGRTLQLDVRRAFASAPEALAALEETLASDASYVAAPVALEKFLAQYQAVLTTSPSAPLPFSIVPPAGQCAVGAPCRHAARRRAAPRSRDIRRCRAPFAASTGRAARRPHRLRRPRRPLRLSRVPAPTPVSPPRRRRSRSRPFLSVQPRLRCRAAVCSAAPRGAAQGPAVDVRSDARGFDLGRGSRAADARRQSGISATIRPLSRCGRALRRRRAHRFDDDTLDFDAFSPFSSLDDSIAGTPPAGRFDAEPVPEPAPFPPPAALPAMAGARGRARVKVIARGCRRRRH